MHLVTPPEFQETDVQLLIVSQEAIRQAYLKAISPAFSESPPPAGAPRATTDGLGGTSFEDNDSFPRKFHTVPIFPSLDLLLR